jgi:hypothetical protein
MLRDQVEAGQSMSNTNGDMRGAQQRNIPENSAQKQKGRTPRSDLPFNAMKTGNVYRSSMRLTTSLLRSCRSGFSLSCLLVRRLLVRRLLVCLSRRSSSCRSSRSSSRSCRCRSLCECSRCEEASDQSSDQFVHFVNPQLELINQVTRLLESGR